MANERENTEKFGRDLAGVFWQIFRSVGIGLNPETLEKLEKSTINLAELVRGQAVGDATTIAERVTKVVMDEFERINTRLNELSEKGAHEDHSSRSNKRKTHGAVQASGGADGEAGPTT